MKERTRLLLMAVMTILLVPACVGGRLVKSVQVHPEVDFAPARARIAAPLRVVLTDRIGKEAEIIRGQGHVKVIVTNFRKTIGRVVARSFRSNFREIIISDRETGKGLELVIASFKIGQDKDTMAYHAVLMHDGRLIHEQKGQVEQVQKNITATIFTWKGVLARMTLENLQKNFAQFAEEINGKLLINSALSSFWRKFRR